MGERLSLLDLTLMNAGHYQMIQISILSLTPEKDWRVTRENGNINNEYLITIFQIQFMAFLVSN